jgi:hypothetical protein
MAVVSTRVSTYAPGIGGRTTTASAEVRASDDDDDDDVVPSRLQGFASVKTTLDTITPDVVVRRSWSSADGTHLSQSEPMTQRTTATLSVTPTLGVAVIVVVNPSMTGKRA